MTDHELCLTIAAELDREPECRCVQTDRGTDTLGCPAHDRDYPESVPDENEAMCEYAAMRGHDTATVARPGGQAGVGEGMAKLTPAQWRALVLLAHPGTEARAVSRLFRWIVVDAVGAEIGTIHPRSLFVLRGADYVEWFNGGNGWNDFRQRITPRGREAAAARGAGEGE